jgi:hypothetical protein
MPLEDMFTFKQMVRQFRAGPLHTLSDACAR